LSQETKEHIDILAGGTFFMLNAEEALALFEKLSASEMESEEHGLNENFRTIKIGSPHKEVSGHSHPMGRKCPCLGSVAMLSSTSFKTG
jgi:hypothetical protein